MLGMLGKIAVLIISLVLLLVGANEAYKGWKNPEPTRTTVADYVKSDKSKKWVVLTDAEINLLHAVTLTTTITITNNKTHELVSSKERFRSYIPIESAGFTQNDTVSLLLETDDTEILDVARQLEAMSGEKSVEFIVRERDKLIRSVELAGLVESESSMESSMAQEIRKRIKKPAGYFYILKHNQSELGLTGGLIIMGIGLLILTIFIFSLRRKKDDFQVQPATLPIPHSPSIIIPPEMDDVVLQQKSVLPPEGRKEKMPRDYYKILEISHSADLEEIKQAAQTKGNDIRTALSFAFLSHTEAQARLNEIEEAFETLSKPETRAAYDPQWQPVESPTPDRDESQVSSYPSPTISLTDADRDTTEIELAGPGTRLRAVITDVLIMLAPGFFVGFFSDKIATAEFNIEEKTAELVAHFAEIVMVPSIIGIIMTNLVLLYCCGQTLGKRICSIKIVNTEGSRVGSLLILLIQGLLVPLVVILLPIAAFGNGLALSISIIGTLIAIALLVDSRLIFQNSRRYLHDLMANTIEVKVLPAKSPMPHSPPILLHPKMENVVVEQKPAPPTDRDKSQVSPYQPPTVSLTDADRHATEIELAGRGTRLLAVIADIFIQCH